MVLSQNPARSQQDQEKYCGDERDGCFLVAMKSILLCIYLRNGSLLTLARSDERCAHILVPEQQILARLPIGAGEESGETPEVQRQVAFMRKSYRVRNGGEGPVRGGEEQFGSLNPTLDDILMRSKAG